MSAETKIQWTDKTWNPVRGCSIVSPGCVNCYAMKQAHRFSGKGRAYEGLTKLTSVGPQWTGKVSLVESALLEPLKWRKPQRVFVNSMSDLFHEAVPDEFIDRVFAVMALAPLHTFQLLSKRPERMREYSMGHLRPGGALEELRAAMRQVPGHQPNNFEWPLPNVWLGVSCEDQQRADERIPLLLQTPAAVRFISAEPLIGPINLRRVWDVDGRPADIALDWCIVGGESGPGARPCHVSWIRSIVQQCQAASVPVFVKQVGAIPRLSGPLGSDWTNPCRVTAASGGTHIVLKDRKGGDPDEWPKDLRVRQFPNEQRGQ